MIYCNGNFDFGNLACNQNRSDVLESIDERYIYPNHVKNLLFIRGYENQPLHAKVLSLDGKVMKQFKTKNLNEGLSVEDLSSGIYLIKITSEKNNIQKIFKMYKK